jgi:hypothetical protein
MLLSLLINVKQPDTAVGAGSLTAYNSNPLFYMICIEGGDEVNREA